MHLEDHASDLFFWKIVHLIWHLLNIYIMPNHVFDLIG